MVRKYDIEFVEADAPITEPVTKFGGQPVWIEEPAWPLSRKLGKPMQFICQVSLDLNVFVELSGQMAYLFMTGDREIGEKHIDTFDPKAGENAVVIQPGGIVEVETAQESTGPSLYWMDDEHPFPVPCEYAVELESGEDMEFVGDEELWSWEETARETHIETLEGNKIGGTPGFLQGEEFPRGGPWKQLLQLDSVLVPFDVNFGDAGIGHAFISESGEEGRFLWQCA